MKRTGKGAIMSCMVSYGLSISQVAEYLGVPVETARSMQRRGRLPPADVVIGEGSPRPVRGWSRKCLDDWVQRRAKLMESLTTESSLRYKL